MPEYLSVRKYNLKEGTGMSSISSVSNLFGSTSTNGLRFTGLASTLDTDALIEGLLAIQKAKITSLENKQSDVATMQTVFQGLQGKVVLLLSDAINLGRSVNSAFDFKTATSTDTSLLTAAASSSATPGVYAMRVNSLAKSQQIASQGFDSLTSEIKTGTLDIKVGSGATTTITVDGTNNTLQGLVNTINNTTTAEVTASIINDGSDSRTQPYRLLLTSKKTGASNAITLTNNLDGPTGSKPRFDTTYVGPAVKDVSFVGTSAVTSNVVPAGGYTGTANNTYSFNVTSASGGGVVGTDTITIDWVDTSSPVPNSGTITLDATYIPGNTVAVGPQGIQVQFGAGNLAVGDKFTVDAFVPDVQAAADASVTVGSGPGAITVTSATNTVDGIIPGVTLNLLGADPLKEVSLTIANDTANVKTSILNFVDDYNDLLDYINDRSTYDQDTETAGILLGNNDAFSIKNKLMSEVGSIVDNVATAMNRLSALGITLSDTGKLDVDESKLDQALAGQLSGVSYNDVRRLFTLDGVSNNAGIKFILGGDETEASGAIPYQVDITAAARQATLTAGVSPLASPFTTITTGVNDTFIVKLNGKTSGTLTLAAGNYTPLELAQEVQGKINADAALGGAKVVATVDASNFLKITTETYGSATNITIDSGNALATLGFAGGETNTGLDVVGQFIVNGTPESATGTGQVLRGNTGNANTEGLQVMVTLVAAQVGPGVEATSFTVTRGIASSLSIYLGDLDDTVNGKLKNINDAFQADIDLIQDSIDRQNELLDQERDSLLKQFTDLELTLNKLKSASSFLTSQLGSANMLSGLGGKK